MHDGDACEHVESNVLSFVKSVAFRQTSSEIDRLNRFPVVFIDILIIC